MKAAFGLFLMLITLEAHATRCYEAIIVCPCPFVGNDGEIVRLNDGTLWELQFGYNNLDEHFPVATICPGSLRLIVNGISFNLHRLN